MELRVADAGDREWVWQVANSPDVRAWSFSPESIPWDAHCAWFAERLTDPDCLFLIGEHPPGSPVSMIRFDRVEDAWELTVAVSAEQRGRGFGSATIRGALGCHRRQHGDAPVRALVREGNEASLRAFERAGFLPRGHTRRKGFDARVYLATSVLRD